MQAVRADIEARGAKLVALVPQLTEHHQGMIDRHGLTFDMLSDPGNDYAHSLGIRFTVPEALQAVYLARGIDLPKHNGDDSWTLPIPARLVVDRTGVVRAADIDVDYTRRPEPEKTLADLDGLS